MGERSDYHHGNLREALLDAACAVIREHGVAGLSMRAVARRAGVSQAAPYHHFENKEALVADVCVRAFRELSERTEAAVAAGGTTVEKLRRMAAAYLRFAQDRPQFFGLMFGGKGMLENRADYETLVETFASSLQQLVEVIEEGVAAGELYSPDPIGSALASWAAVHGAVALTVEGAFEGAKMKSLGATPARVLDCVLDTVVRGLAP